MNNAPTLDLSRQLPLGLDLPKQYHQRLLYLENIFQKEDRIKWVVRVPALRRTLNCFAEAEKIYHYWAKQTATAISWTGGFATSVALFALGFNIWTHFGKDGEEEKRRKRADALDRARPRRNDAEDEERRRMEDEEDKKRREKKEEEEAEREEAGREAEERKTKAAEQLEDMIQGFRYVRFNGKSFLSHPALRLSRDPVGANLLGRFSHDFYWKEELADLETFQAEITSYCFANSLPQGQMLQRSQSITRRSQR